MEPVNEIDLIRYVIATESQQVRSRISKRLAIFIDLISRKSTDAQVKELMELLTIDCNIYNWIDEPLSSQHPWPPSSTQNLQNNLFTDEELDTIAIYMNIFYEGRGGNYLQLFKGILQILQERCPTDRLLNLIITDLRESIHFHQHTHVTTQRTISI